MHSGSRVSAEASRRSLRSRAGGRRNVGGVARKHSRHWSNQRGPQRSTTRPPWRGPRDVARRVDLPKSTAYRVLGMLVRVGAVDMKAPATGSRYRWWPSVQCGPRSGPSCRASVPAGSAPGYRAHLPSVRPARPPGSTTGTSCRSRRTHHRPPRSARHSGSGRMAGSRPYRVREPAGGERRAGTGSGPAGGRAERCGTCRSTRSTSPRSCSPRAASSTPCWHRTGSPPPSCSASR
ncbi:hypothetical protein CA983_30090 [Streptomyces swartbergensis]|uniref:HTH iclR-type domain-containing protein n=1 Tax=Streptomyces swartbergensis TaxID=487165 RepID=A0A243RRY1_9ACTN|nr:hypothetical protein CA983_30090 [Streptomyces swartbergensis]